MYVVNKGLLEVLGGPFGNTVLTELRPGSAFGEIRYVERTPQRIGAVELLNKGHLHKKGYMLWNP